MQKKTQLTVLLAVLVIALAIAGAYIYATYKVIGDTDTLSAPLLDQSATTTDLSSLPETDDSATPPAPVTGTATFSSKLLGVSFEYPRIWGTAEERLVPAISDSDKGLNLDHYQLSISDQEVLNIRADNKQTAEYAYEGCPSVIEYYGQPLEDICTTRSFLSGCPSTVSVQKCELRHSTSGVPYVWVKASALNDYGAAAFPTLGLFSPPVAHAKDNWTTEEGIIFQTHSTRFPGMSMIVRDWTSSCADTACSDYAIEHIEKSKNDLRAIQDLAPTLRYTNSQ